jgi:hypothetical protein
MRKGLSGHSAATALGTCHALATQAARVLANKRRLLKLLERFFIMYLPHL